MSSKKNSVAKSYTFRVPVEGAYGYELTGPHGKCGKEDRGGVSVSPINHDGKVLAGGVFTREAVRHIHWQFGEWIKLWDKEEGK